MNFQTCSPNAPFPPSHFSQTNWIKQMKANKISHECGLVDGCSFRAILNNMSGIGEILCTWKTFLKCWEKYCSLESQRTSNSGATSEIFDKVGARPGCRLCPCSFSSLLRCGINEFWPKCTDRAFWPKMMDIRFSFLAKLQASRCSWTLGFGRLDCTAEIRNEGFGNQQI